jgi:hypothetical protein
MKFGLTYKPLHVVKVITGEEPMLAFMMLIDLEKAKSAIQLRQ